MATQTQRNARLDALEQATRQYAEKQRKELKRRVSVCKQILKGRTGSDRLAQAAVDQSSSLVVTTINDFLTG